jgi:hypothetical protein
VTGEGLSLYDKAMENSVAVMRYLDSSAQKALDFLKFLVIMTDKTPNVGPSLMAIDEAIFTARHSKNVLGHSCFIFIFLPAHLFVFL